MKSDARVMRTPATRAGPPARPGNDGGPGRASSAVTGDRAPSAATLPPGSSARPAPSGRLLRRRALATATADSRRAATSVRSAAGGAAARARPSAATGASSTVAPVPATGASVAPAPASGVADAIRRSPSGAAPTPGASPRPTTITPPGIASGVGIGAGSFGGPTTPDPGLRSQSARADDRERRSDGPRRRRPRAPPWTCDASSLDAASAAPSATAPADTSSATRRSTSAGRPRQVRPPPPVRPRRPSLRRSGRRHPAPVRPRPVRPPPRVRRALWTLRPTPNSAPCAELGSCNHRVRPRSAELGGWTGSSSAGSAPRTTADVRGRAADRRTAGRLRIWTRPRTRPRSPRGRADHVAVRRVAGRVVDRPGAALPRAPAAGQRGPPHARATDVPVARHADRPDRAGPPLGRTDLRGGRRRRSGLRCVQRRGCRRRGCCTGRRTGRVGPRSHRRVGELGADGRAASSSATARAATASGERHRVAERRSGRHAGGHLVAHRYRHADCTDPGALRHRVPPPAPRPADPARRASAPPARRPPVGLDGNGASGASSPRRRRLVGDLRVGDGRRTPAASASARRGRPGGRSIASGVGLGRGRDVGGGVWVGVGVGVRARRARPGRPEGRVGGVGRVGAGGRRHRAADHPARRRRRARRRQAHLGDRPSGRRRDGFRRVGVGGRCGRPRTSGATGSPVAWRAERPPVHPRRRAARTGRPPCADGRPARRRARAPGRATASRAHLPRRGGCPGPVTGVRVITARVRRGSAWASRGSRCAARSGRSIRGPAPVRDHRGGFAPPTGAAAAYASANRAASGAWSPTQPVERRHARPGEPVGRRHAQPGESVGSAARAARRTSRRAGTQQPGEPIGERARAARRTSVGRRHAAAQRTRRQRARTARRTRRQPARGPGQRERRPRGRAAAADRRAGPRAAPHVSDRRRRCGGASAAGASILSAASPVRRRVGSSSARTADTAARTGSAASGTGTAATAASPAGRTTTGAGTSRSAAPRRLDHEPVAARDGCPGGYDSISRSRAAAERRPRGRSRRPRRRSGASSAGVPAMSRAGVGTPGAPTVGLPPGAAVRRSASTPHAVEPGRRAGVDPVARRDGAPHRLRFRRAGRTRRSCPRRGTSCRRARWCGARLPTTVRRCRRRRSRPRWRPGRARPHP